MKSHNTAILITWLSVWMVYLFTAPCSAQVIWDRTQLDQVQSKTPSTNTAETSTAEKQALVRLKALADDALQHRPRSVTEKETKPPSGDIHDYQSFSRYWWPDPDKPDGLPYIRKDGVVNRKLLARGDRNKVGEFMDDVQVLALAGHFFKDKRYTQHAANMVRVWFLDEATKMNPNLDFGQGVPGRAHGRGPGIIDTRGFMFVLDSVELFGSDTWPEEDQRALQAWFKEYVAWLQTDELGLHEQKAKNNHGSWYAAQVARYAVFSGDVELAKNVVEAAKQRIARQFDEHGNQAEEIKRTRSLHYSMFNLTALANLAQVGDKVGVDLWEFTPEHGFGLQKSMSSLLPYLAGESRWPHPQLEPYTLSRSAHMTLRLFAQEFSDPSFTDVVPQMKLRHPDLDYTVLLIGLLEK